MLIMDPLPNVFRDGRKFRSEILAIINNTFFSQFLGFLSRDGYGSCWAIFVVEIDFVGKIDNTIAMA